MFSGWKENNHSGRCIHEICGFIVSGKINFGILKSDNTYDKWEFLSWKGIKFTSEDLINYIEKDSLHTPIINSLEPYYKLIKIHGKTICTKTYVLNLEYLREEYSKSFHKIKQ